MTNQSNDHVLIEKQRLGYLQGIEKAVSEQGHLFNILRVASSKKRPSTLHIFEYGAIVISENEIILFPTHYAGLFSILSTTMWTVIDSIENYNVLPTRIDTTFSMMHFKDEIYSNNPPLGIAYTLLPLEFFLDLIANKELSADIFIYIPTTNIEDPVRKLASKTQFWS